MTIAILVNGEAALHQAGTRIRYQRIIDIKRNSKEKILIASSINELLAITDLKMVIIGKFISCLSIIAARQLSQNNILVGIDVFDDYFSNEVQKTVFQRYWISKIENYLDFCVCSTLRMKNILKEITKKPIYCVEDPVSQKSIVHSVRQLLQKKHERLVNCKDLTVTWFGMGDNPIFSVGIEDLHAWLISLCELNHADKRFHLNILTNKRALSEERLLLLAQCPMPIRLLEWSEILEEQLLKETDIAFIPVNYQNFSIAKSPNRALTALINGCQVLSPGYNLYHQLDDFIYRSVEDVIKDISKGTFIFNINKVNAFENCINLNFDSTKALNTINSITTNKLLQQYEILDNRKKASCLVLLAGINPINLEEYSNSFESTIFAALPYASNSRAIYDIYFDNQAAGCYLMIKKEKYTSRLGLPSELLKLFELNKDSQFFQCNINCLKEHGILSSGEVYLIKRSMKWNDLQLKIFLYSDMITVVNKLLALLIPDFNIIFNEKSGCYWLPPSPHF